MPNLGRRRLGDEGLQHRIQRTSPAQHRGGETVRGRAVPWLQRRKRAERLLERASSLENGAEKIERGFAGRIGHGVSREGGAWSRGGAEGNRTPDLLIANEALSQLSYSPGPR